MLDCVDSQGFTSVCEYILICVSSLAVDSVLIFLDGTRLFLKLSSGNRGMTAVNYLVNYDSDNINDENNNENVNIFHTT